MSETESILFVDGIVEPAKLAALLQVNVSMLYQEKQMGRFGNKEFLETEQRRQERADRKAQRAAASNPENFGDFEDTMHPLMKKKLEQEIKLSKVKEVQAWLKVADEKKYFLYGAELTALLEPFLHVIKNILISISTEYPETEEKINNCMNSLHDLSQQWNGQRSIELLRQKNHPLVLVILIQISLLIWSMFMNVWTILIFQTYLQ